MFVLAGEFDGCVVEAIEGFCCEDVEALEECGRRQALGVKLGQQVLDVGALRLEGLEGSTSGFAEGVVLELGDGHGGVP